MLARNIRELSVSEIMEAMQGPTDLGFKHRPDSNRYIIGDQAFNKLWARVNKVVANIYNETTFEKMKTDEMERSGTECDYII